MGRTLLSELPPETLEHILSSLSPLCILKMKETSRFFQRFVSSSQCLQHRIDLFGEGLVDNPHAVFNLAERRERLREYADRWKNPEVSVQYSCSLKSRSSVARLYPVGQDLLSARADYDSPIVSFTRIPSSPSQETAEEWTLEFQFYSWDYLAYSQENLLAIIEDKTGFINIHLLNLRDGSPHKIPLKKVLQLNTGNCRGFLLNAQIGDSRIALVVGFLRPNDESRRELIAWDWRTGEVVLEHSNDDPGIGCAISGISAIHFLEGSWLVALSDRGVDPQLLVFDTLVPQQNPRSWRILQLPRLPRHAFYMVPPRHGNQPAEHPEFCVDPTQRTFVVQSYRGPALVIPVKVFTHPARADPCIRWEDWGRDVMKLHLHPDTAALQLVDTKALALRNSPQPEGLGVELYDLSKSGRKDIRVQQVSEEQDKGCRKMPSAPRWFHRLQMGFANSTFLIGNKVVCLSSGSPPSGEGSNLRVWKIG